jgi:hypothetical protein
MGGRRVLLARLCLALTRSKLVRPQLCDTSRKQPDICGASLHFTRCLASVVHDNDATAWQELLILPKTVLDAPRRGGRQHQKAVASYTLDRLQRWQAGERQSLWDTRGKVSGPRRYDLSVTQRQEMAINLAREGHDRKACLALLSTGLCPDTPATVQALRGLHPAHPQPSARPMHDLPLAPEVVPDAVAKALRSFPR